MSRPCPIEPIDLICEVVDLYHEARTPCYPHQKIQRGESRAIFAQIEDLFAGYMAEKFEDRIDKVLINQNLMFGKGVNKKPDITMISDGRAKVFIDLKMDLGYNRRGFIDLCRDTNDWLENVKEKPFHYFTKEAPDNKMESFVSNDAVWLYIVISNLNMSAESAREIKSCCAETYFLLEGIHPNIYKPSKKMAVQYGLVPGLNIENHSMKGIVKANKLSIIETFNKLHARINTSLAQ